LRYDLDQFNRDIQSGGLIIEIDGFAEFFKPGNHKKLGQSEAFIRLSPEALLETTEEGYEHSSSEPWLVAPADPAYEAVKEGYLELANQVEPRDWWHNLKLPEIKRACRLAGVNVGSKKKDELIRELIERNAPYPEDAPLPYCPTTKCYDALRDAISTYITAITVNANRFHPTYIAHIWDAALDANPYGQIRRAIREAIRDQYWLERMQPE